MLHMMKPAREAVEKRFFPKLANANRAQAVSELAIFGTLIIVGFAAMLSYIQSMNAQQSLQMEAFRKAMSLSRSMAKEITYNIVRDSPVMDVSDAVGRPDLSRQSASSIVMAMRIDERGDDENPNDRDTAEFYEVNGTQQEIQPMRIQVTYGSGGTQKPWISPPVIDTEFRATKHRTGAVTRSEMSGTISSNLNAQVSILDNTTLVMKDMSNFLSDYLQDAQDYAHEASWKKQARAGNRIWDDLGTSIHWLIDINAGGALQPYVEPGEHGANQYGECPGLQWAAPSFKHALLAVVGVIVGDILASILRDGNTQGIPTAVSVLGTYPGNIAISGSADFSPPAQSFSVGN